MSILKDSYTLAVCMPAYEKTELVRRSLDSIKIQTFKDYVVIITDDSVGSSIEELISEYKDIDIIYRRNVKQLGAAENTNKALEIAYGMNIKYIKLLHQDDFLSEETSLEKMITLAVDNNLDAVFSANYEVYCDKVCIHDASQEDVSLIRDDRFILFRGNLLGAPSVVLFRANNMYFDPAFSWLHDIDFYVRLLDGAKWEYINEPLISIGHDGTQLTDYVMENREMVAKETYRMYSKYKELHDTDNRKYLVSIIRDHYLSVKKSKLKGYFKWD